MVHFLVTICAIAVPVVISANTDLVRTNRTARGSIINLTPSTFKDLIGGSKYIIDNTLLLEQLLGPDPNAVQVIAVPRRFGKTLSIQMIKEFLQINIDKSGNRISINETENYRLFTKGEVIYENKTIKLEKDLLIKSKAEIMKWLGTVPILHLALQADLNKKIYSLRNIYEVLKERIGQSFKEHEYLATIPQWKNKLQRYRKLPSHCDVDDIHLALVELSQMLYEFFKHRVYVLVDDYDGLINDAYKKSSINITERNSIVSFFQDFYGLLLKDNPNIQGGIMIGQEVRRTAIPSNISVHDDESDLMEYFGMDPEHPMTLLTELKIWRYNRTLYQKCDEYQFGTKKQFTRLSQFTIALNLKKVKAIK